MQCVCRRRQVEQQFRGKNETPQDHRTESPGWKSNTHTQFVHKVTRDTSWPRKVRECICVAVKERFLVTLHPTAITQQPPGDAMVLWPTEGPSETSKS